LKYLIFLILIAFTSPAIAQTSASTTDSAQALEPIYKYVEKMPTFDGDMVEFIYKNLKYPKEAKKNDVEGRVFLTFVIRRDGSITDIEVVRSAGQILDEAAIDVVKRMPKWRPGQQKGENVSCFYTLPVDFRLR
jgi:protein TonB